ncbi:MAG: CCDC90 family protein [Enterobacteriaceae bacterium]|jgi:5-enolpyruvylshikimate-3-phosphate synthase|nr:CCDC90 family protein [Enterobacteriaceae bacterium]
MTALTMSTHKSLKESGMDETQAEKLIEIITELQNVSVATKEDIKQTEVKLKADLSTIKTDIDWLKKLIMTIGVAVVIAAIKYIFVG